MSPDRFRPPKCALRRDHAAQAAIGVLFLVLGCGSPSTDEVQRSAAAEEAAPTRTSSAPFVRVLGTAQDGGFPHAACSHDLCVEARRDPALARRVASLAVVLPESGRVFLIDATPDLPEQLEALADVRRPPAGGVDRAPVDGVLLTHAHVGHYLGLAYFGYEALHTRDLPVWATPRMARFLRNNGPWSQLVSRGNVELRELEVRASRVNDPSTGRPRRPEVAGPDGESEGTEPAGSGRQDAPPGSPEPPEDAGSGGAAVPLGDGVAVRAVPVPHRDEYTDTVGFRLEGPRATVLYVPDTDSWDAWGDRLDEALSGVDVALVDGTFYSAAELPGRDVAEIGHPLITDSLARFGDAVRSGDLRLLFIHLNHSNPALDPDGPERRAIEEAGFRVAADGEEIPL